MARLFNGTSDAASVSLDLSGVSAITVSFWLWWDSFASNDNKLAMEFGTPNGEAVSGFIFNYDNSNAPISGKILMEFATTTLAWSDGVTRPSAAAWHHYMYTLDRSAKANAAWIDGVSQTLTTGGHSAGTYNNFANSTLFVMCRNNASLFGAGRMAALGLWGVALGQTEATALAAGGLPESVHLAGLISSWRLAGTASPEPDTIGGHNLTLTGTSQAADPSQLPATTTPFKFGGATVALELLDQLDRLNR